MRPAVDPRRIKAARAGIGIAVIALGMLIWIKMRIVAPVPRSVLADPDAGPARPPAPVQHQPQTQTQAQPDAR